MDRFTIVSMASNDLAYCYIWKAEKMPTLKQAKKILSDRQLDVVSVLAIVETPDKGSISCQGLTFYLN